VTGSEGVEWLTWDYSGTGEWPEKWPPVRLRRISEHHILFEVMPGQGTGNMLGGLHGGFLSSYAENALGIFVAPFDLPVQAITVSLSFDYPAGGRAGVLLEGEAELVRETGRMQFVRLTLSQEGHPILIGSGVLRKVPR
jgi:acyl-coenzyme A thioesterase PaaI-like protein